MACIPKFISYPKSARNPSCLTPLTRLIPAANSGLSKTRIGGFVSHTTHGRKLLIHGIGSQVRLQVHAITHDDDAVEGQQKPASTAVLQ